MKNIMKIIQVFSFIMLYYYPANSQQDDFEKFAQEREQYAKEQEEEFQKFAKEQNEYIKKMDEAFAEYLEKRWQEFQAFKARQMPQKPKPYKQPLATDDIRGQASQAIKNTSDKTTKNNTAHKPLLLKDEEKVKLEKLAFQFFGNNLSVNYDPRTIRDLNHSINEQNISQWWTDLSQSQYSILIKKLYAYKEKMNLNDWGYYMLISQTAKQITQSANAAVLFKWFLLTKSGYMSRLAYNNNKLFLLLPFTKDIYEKPYILLDQTKYYFINKHEANVNTYNKDFPEAYKVIDLNISKPFFLSQQSKTKKIKFGEQYIELSYNPDVVEFYKNYPLTELSVYFNARPSTTLKSSINEAFEPLFKDKSDLQKVSEILQFVQDLDYATDQQQFQHEKFMFPDEVLHYDKSDCEDRSVFFAYLIRQLTNLKTIGLEYNDHVATAVKLPDHESGNYINYEGEHYMVCDPTYKNAPVGYTQPDYIKQTAKTIKISNNHFWAEKKNNLRKKLISKGLFQGNVNHNIAFDKNHNAYITGYYNKNIKIGNQVIKSNDQSNEVYVVKFTPEGQLSWIKTLNGKGSDIGSYLQVRDDKILIAGSYSEQISGENQFMKTNSKNPDIFIASYSPSGSLEWIKKMNLDKSLPEGNAILHATIETSSGKLTDKQFFSEHEAFNQFGIFFKDHGKAMISIGLKSTPGLYVEEKSYARYANFEPVKVLKEENDKYINQNYHPSVTGLFAAFGIIENSGMTLPGHIVQNALDQNNPGFQKKYPNVYNNIGKVQFIRNEKGIVMIKTDHKGPVQFSNLKINNLARFKICFYSSGNLQIDILSGISVGKAFIWYDLNHIKIFKQTGHLNFDYDEDHTKKQISMAEILK